MRKLASIRKITDISPIEGADRIEVATVDGWKVVVGKDVGHKVGDIVIYCEVDSFLPIHPRFEFLRKSSYRKLNDGSEGFRLKTIRLRGQLSQGLIIPLNVLDSENGVVEWSQSDDLIGKDVTDLLGITKWDPPLPAQLQGKVKGYFPSFIPKTDEERIQNLTEEYEDYKDRVFYCTEKLDGSSATFYIKDGEFGVCSRNLELLEDASNTFWKVARELRIEEKLKEHNIDNFALQGELIGEGIQKNPYKLKGQTVRFFSGYDIDDQQRIGIVLLESLLDRIGLDTVPILTRYLKLPDTVEELIDGADGASYLNLSTKREGLVYRNYPNSISFKVISNEFLLNED